MPCVRSPGGSRGTPGSIPAGGGGAPYPVPRGRWRGSVSRPARAVAMPRVRSRAGGDGARPRARAVAVPRDRSCAGGPGQGGRCRPGGPGASPGGPGRPRTRRCGRRSRRERRCRSRRATGGGRRTPPSAAAPQGAGWRTSGWGGSRCAGQASPSGRWPGRGSRGAGRAPGALAGPGRPGPRVHRPPRLRGRAPPGGGRRRLPGGPWRREARAGRAPVLQVLQHPDRSPGSGAGVPACCAAAGRGAVGPPRGRGRSARSPRWPAPARRARWERPGAPGSARSASPYGTDGPVGSPLHRGQRAAVCGDGVRGLRGGPPRPGGGGCRGGRAAGGGAISGRSPGMRL